MLGKLVKIGGGIIALGLVGVFAGPSPSFEEVNNTPSAIFQDIQEIESAIQQREKQIPFLKEDNEARVVWADSAGEVTEYSIVYLHGFSASQGEGYPIHLNLADSLGANMFLSRLPEHGVDYLDAMKDLTPKMLVESAKEAVAIGKTIGEKVIVIGCSTGGTLGIYVAAGDPDIDALILLSPNIEVNADALKLATGPWGKTLVRQTMGEHRVMTSEQSYKPYWSYQYHTNGLIAMQSLLDQTMNKEVFEQLNLPIYCAYFYKNEEVRDKVVSIDAILDFEGKLKVNKENVEFEAFERGNHVLGSVYKNENWRDVQDEILVFLKEKVL